MSHITILNADGIYLALYSSLLLNLKLIRCNYYRDSASPIPLTEVSYQIINISLYRLIDI